MGTTDNFDSPAVATFDLTDTLPVIDSVTTRAATATGAQVLSGLSGVVNTTATTLLVTRALHGNRTVTISSGAPIAVTLPQATGTGARYRFVVLVDATGTASTIKVANATDVMTGVAWVLTSSSANVIGYSTSATSDTVSLDGTTRGGVVGDLIEISDVATGVFFVKMHTRATGTTATPFTASVSS